MARLVQTFIKDDRGLSTPFALKPSDYPCLCIFYTAATFIDAVSERLVGLMLKRHAEV